MPTKNNKQSNYEWLREQIVGKELPDTCMLWPFGADSEGYGQVYVVDIRGYARVHRIAFKLLYGHWPTPCGLHTCDIAACFNPKHIIEGTVRDNNNDCCEKGRQARGEKHGTAVLTEALVHKIRSAYLAEGATTRDLAGRFHISQANVRYIVRRQTWRHI